jgi:N-acyl homoserine lactone hydrolase
MASELAVHVLDGGTLDVPRQAIYHHGGESVLTIPVPSFLIRHPKGDVVFEGGNQLEVAQDPGAYWGVVADAVTPHMGEHQHVKAQVEALDVDPASIRYVVHSHLHLDHTGAVGHFPNASEIVHREELAYAYSPDWYSAFVYQRQDFDREGIRWEFVDLSEDAPILDLYGDGTIQLLFTPGHSVGHMSLIINLDGQPLILAGDAADAQPHYDSEVLPGWYLDAPAVVRSLQRLKRHEQNLDALVVFGHSMEQWETLKKGPDAYV